MFELWPFLEMGKNEKFLEKLHVIKPEKKMLDWNDVALLLSMGKLNPLQKTLLRSFLNKKCGKSVGKKIKKCLKIAKIHSERGIVKRSFKVIIPERTTLQR